MARKPTIRKNSAERHETLGPEVLAADIIALSITDYRCPPKLAVSDVCSLRICPEFGAHFCDFTPDGVERQAPRKVRCYRKRQLLKASIEQFWSSPWFEMLAEAANFDPEYLRELIDKHVGFRDGGTAVSFDDLRNM